MRVNDASKFKIAELMTALVCAEIMKTHVPNQDRSAEAFVERAALHLKLIMEKIEKEIDSAS